MSLVKPRAGPGFLSQATQVQAVGNWYAGNLVRWRTGLLEKMDGWRRLIEESIGYVMRRFHAWLDLDNRKNLLIAADDGVHLLVDNTLYPMGHGTMVSGGYVVEVGDSGARAKFSVTSGSTEVTVKVPVPAALGQTFVFILPVSIGRRIIPVGTTFKVKALVAGGFTFDMTFAATATETDVVGLRLFNNNAPNQLTCTWNQHGLDPGMTIRFEQLTACQAGVSQKWEKINFVAVSGTRLTVLATPTADTFTLGMETAGTGNGGGTTQHQFFDGERVGHNTGEAAPFFTSLGNVIGLIEPMQPGDPQTQAWFLGNLGQDGLVLQAGGPLQVYKPPIENGSFLASVGSATSPPTAPQKSNGFVVAMPQAQVILWGSSAQANIAGKFTEVHDPLLIVWSDIGTYDDYQLSVSKQAGSFRLSRGSRIMGAIQAPQATLILTDTDLWLMSYIGPPLIYGFTIIGSGCGLVAPHAIGTLGRLTIWQGQKNFWIYDSAVQPLQCTVWDYIFRDIDPVNINKCHAAPNSTTNEMGFYFPSKTTLINVDRNLLLSSQDFDAANWALINTIAQRPSIFENRYVYDPQLLISGWLAAAGMSPISWLDDDLQAILENIILAPNMTDTAMLLSELAVDGSHSASQTIRKAREKITYTFSIYAHKSSTRNLALRATSDFGEVSATFDTITGNRLAGTVSGKFALLKAVVLPNELGPSPDWRRYVLTFTSDDFSSLNVFITLANGQTLAYPGVPPKGVLIWGAQLVLGGEPLGYQQTGIVAHQNETRFYVKVNQAEGMAWDSGRLSRSAWLDESVWGPPLGADTTPIPIEGARVPVLDEPVPTVSERNLIQQHEIGYDDDVDPMQGVYAETGYTELGDGTAVMLCDEVHPDLKWAGRDGAMKISLRAANYPQGPKHLYGPWSMTPTTQWFTPRVRARYVAIRYDWEPRFGFSARIGVTTFKVKPAGKLP
jgi:hypothetical protein